MADSISILKGSLKPGAIERPILQVDKTVSDYFERSLKERINDYGSVNANVLSDNFADNNLNNQALSHSVNNNNRFEQVDYNTPYYEREYSYKDDKSQVNGSGSNVRAMDNQVNNNNGDTVSSKNETQINESKSPGKSDELTANNNQKINSKQVDSKAESKSESPKNVKISGDFVAKAKAEIKSFPEEMHIIKDGKTTISNLIINKKAVEVSVQKNIKLSEKLQAAADATTLKLNNANGNNEFSNIKIQPGFVSKSPEIIQDVRNGDTPAKAIDQVINYNKDITGLFIKQNETIVKNESLNKVDNILPNLNNTAKEKIAENLNNKANVNENNLLPKDEKIQLPSSKFSTDFNSQSNYNLSRSGIAERVYNTPKISAKEIDLTNTVGLARVRLEEIADKTLQVAKNLQNNTTYTARLNLKPPSLGTVNIEITMKDDIAKLVMKADSREVAKNLENQLIQLKDKLNQQGIKTESIKIEIRHVENDITDRHAFFEGSNARHKDGKANREFIGTLNQLRSDEENFVTTDEENDGFLVNTNFL